MNKTISANISGFIFNIEEDAYNKLLAYLDSIKSFFYSAEGGEEIIADIEARIAELFQERLSDVKQVITSKDVDEVSQIMGLPEQYGAPDDADDGYTREKETKSASNDASLEDEPEVNENRKIYRDADDRLIGGVCAGISHWFGWDPLWLRLALVLAVIFGGVGIFIYLILWALIPEAKTTAEKLQMKGKPVNIETISKKVNQEMENVKAGVSNIADKTKRAGSKVSESTKKAAGNLEGFLKAFLKIVVKLFGVGIFLTGIFMLIGAIVGWIAIDTMVFRDEMSWPMFEQLILDDLSSTPLAIMGIVLTVGSIILALIWVGLKILLDIRNRVRGIGLIFFGFFIMGVIFLSITGMSIGRTFGWDEDIKQESIVTLQSTDTLFVNVGFDDVFNDTYNYDGDDNPFSFIKEDGDHYIMGGSTRLSFKHIDTGDVKVAVVREACGRSRMQATEHAENIAYNWSVDSNYVDLAPYFTVPLNDKFKCQEVDITITVPEGTLVKLSDNAGRIYHRSWDEGKLRRVTRFQDKRDEDETYLDWEDLD
jgi:phage shock protein PspC (stress-responsive transcriptional regulator)